MEYVTREILEEEKNKFIDFYKDKMIPFKGDYLIFAAEENNVKILIYQSKKGYKISFQGDNALSLAKKFFPDAILKEQKVKEKTYFIDKEEQIGSDEVGTGDLFGPIVITACYYGKEIEEILKTYHIDDSKKLSDENIIKICEKIIPFLTFSKYTIKPKQYNELIKKGYSLNAIKAIFHNRALKSLAKKIAYKNIYIDQFCEVNLFYNYLNKANEKAIEGINFFIKGESKFPSVALASMISRYSFLKYWENMCQEYNLAFPKGANKKCDEFLKLFLEKYDLNKLEEVAKLNFKNVKDLI